MQMLYIGEKGKNFFVLITDHESGGSLVTMILILTMFPKRKASYEAGRDMVNESAAKVRDMLARRDSLLEEESAKHQQWRSRIASLRNKLSCLNWASSFAN